MTEQALPTASIHRVDVNPGGKRASAAPVTEALLFRGYGVLQPGQQGIFRVVDRQEMSCACGGTIVRLGGQAVEDVVAAHNESALHRAWRAWRAEL